MLLPKNNDNCPYLQLAPMEGVGDSAFRKAMATIGGFDEAVRDFIRVPSNAHIKSLGKMYNPHELFPIPLAAQIMGSDEILMAKMAVELFKRGAKRIDINCGCPSGTVTGKGAGSSLLKDPPLLQKIAKAVVEAVPIPVTLKMRSGFSDTSLFKENLKAVEESGVKYVTLHPRTKEEGYTPPAHWDLIALAKTILKIPLVGNGDILCVDDALKMLKETKCDGLMIGRGSIIDPFIFQKIKAHFKNQSYTPSKDALIVYLEKYLASIPEEIPQKTRVNKFKQLLGFIFKSTPDLLEKRQNILTSSFEDPYSFLAFAKIFLA